MNDTYVVVILLVVLLIWDIVYIIKGIGNGKWKYELKVAVNSLRPLVHMIWAAYAIIGGAALQPSVNAYAISDAIKPTTPLAEILIRHGLPIAFYLTVIIIVVYAIYSGFQPIMKYTDKEKEWQHESSIRFRNKLPKFMQKYVKV